MTKITPEPTEEQLIEGAYDDCKEAIAEYLKEHNLKPDPEDRLFFFQQFIPHAERDYESFRKIFPKRKEKKHG